eukprot:scaffold330079_cov66-Tisochrysis_lutea.AAC.2
MVDSADVGTGKRKRHQVEPALAAQRTYSSPALTSSRHGSGSQTVARLHTPPRRCVRYLQQQTTTTRRS